MIKKISQLNIKKYKIIPSMLLGLFAYAFFFDLSILNITNIDWLFISHPDPATHLVGANAFIADKWMLPLTKTTLLNNPEGLSIIYTDSNPLFSILFKLIRFLLPQQPIQFVGIWFLFCWILQSMFGYLLVYEQTEDYIFSIISSGLFVFLPTLYQRFIHPTLAAQWLILCALFIFISKKDKNRKFLYFLILILISTMVHAYITAMVCLIWICWFLKFIIDIRSSRKELYINIIKFGLSGIIVLIFMWILGYFYNSEATNIILVSDTYSASINSFFNPVYDMYSNFITKPTPFVQNVFAAESFQYIGFGLIILYISIIVFIIHYITKEITLKNIFIFMLCTFLISFSIPISIDWSIKLKIYLIFISILFIVLYTLQSEDITLINYNYLVVLAILCFIFSLSYYIKFNDIRIWTYNLNPRITNIIQAFRSYSRFSFVTTLIILSYFLVLIYKKINININLKYLFVLFILIVQFVDIYDIKDGLDYNKKEININENVEEMISYAEDVKIFPIDNYTKPAPFYNLLLKSVSSNIPVNSTRFVRMGTEFTNRAYEDTEEIYKGIVDDTSLYILFDLYGFDIETVKKTTNRKIYEIDNIFYIPPKTWEAENK